MLAIRGIRLKSKLATAIVATAILSSVLLAMQLSEQSLLAQYTWTDTIRIYKDINAVYSNIREITNNETITVDVKAYITSTEKANLLEYYELSANGTNFIVISQGVVILSNGTYHGLEQGQTLSFTVKAKGSGSLSEDDTVRVGVRVEFWSTDKIHDVAVTSVTLFKSIIGAGLPMSMNITVENQGDFAETLNVTIYAEIEAIGKVENITLTSQDSANIAFTWNTSGFTKGNYSITVVANIAQNETDTDDNVYADGWVLVSIIGDLTGPDGRPDGKCDMRDVGLAAHKFQATPSNPRYDPNYDVVYDLKIDMRDIGLVARHFGETDP